MGETEAIAELSMTAEQLEDFAWLLANSKTLGDIHRLAEIILNEKPGSDDIADKQVVARETVSKLHKQDRIAEAVDLLMRESHPSGAIVLGLRHIMKGERLSSTNALQRLLDLHEPFLSSADMIDLLPKVARRVCAVGLKGIEGRKIRGTGFLIAKDVVITNYHVIEPFLPWDEVTSDFKPTEPGDKIFFFFDYMRAPTPRVPPQTTHNIVAVNAAEDWYVKARPYLPNEGDGKCNKLLNHELDYVLIRLDRPLGSLPVRTGGGAIRGWLPLEEDEIDRSFNRRILVVQHPDEQPQLFDIGKYERSDPSDSRVWYSVNTANGSSGGAAVDTEGKLFALHNATVKINEQLNQGVRIDLIAKDVGKTIAKEEVPQDDTKLVWSLNDSFQDSQPIIGRSIFREYVTRIGDIASPERALVVTGTPPAGLQYSIKLLRRLRRSDAPVVMFSTTELEKRIDEGFLVRLVSELNIGGLAGSMPRESTEADPRWVGELANWLMEALAKDHEKNKTKYPAWLVINTVVSQKQSILWPANLQDLIATLLGRKNDRQIALDVPQLRWLFLVLPDTNLNLAGISHLEEKLVDDDDKQYAKDFEDCFMNAYQSVYKTAPMTAHLARRSAEIYLQQQKKIKSKKWHPRKALAEYVRQLLMDNG